VRVVISGGAGFLGGRLAQTLLDRGSLTGPSGRDEPIESLVVLDLVPPPAPIAADARVEFVAGEIADAPLLERIVDRDAISFFHLASMVSAGCEADFDAAYRVNVDGVRAVLEALRARASAPRIVFSSSIVAYGGLAPHEVAADSTKLTPETTYGTTKAICELLINDYTRKGFVDGRSARLPTVVIRPGRPNAAASSWVSGLFREPLNGEECVVPVDSEMCLPIAGYRTIVENLIALHEVDGAVLGPDRALNLPALDVTAAEMLAGLRRATDRSLGPVEFRVDHAISAFFVGWAQHSAYDRALAAGLRRDPDLVTIIHEYIADYLS
jgi:nucleoside-diphosphate-sugar epimerase